VWVSDKVRAGPRGSGRVRSGLVGSVQWNLAITGGNEAGAAVGVGNVQRARLVFADDNTQREVTSQSLRPRYDHHFVAIT